ncbi:hypothetical protein EGI22_13090 [Lacihabitans sp. LS3-19]|uniref:hypothetical protein n=1 Tax=Lacihabitans sp. LS3-19 TaxID=2487335 RepID=UPI0020CE96A8|nr:hypothetical protein [Lacihabitans sp. LS3-19]MCP9768855.1 hypothetical protein [Lacihabitans sp. LS3-19]
MKKIILLIAIVSISIGFTSCEVADPFVDRVASPVLLLLEGSDGIPTSGLTTEPTIPSLISTDAGAKLKVYELDKSGILDKNIGIDSIPVSGLKISYKLRSGAIVSEVETDSKGVATFSATWKALGIETPKAGTSVKLIASGVYKEQSFSKYFIISGK